MSNVVASRRGSVSSEKQKRSASSTTKGRARSKSPFRSFRWPKKPKPTAAEAEGGAYSDDEDNLRRAYGKEHFVYLQVHLGKVIASATHQYRYLLVMSGTW